MYVLATAGHVDHGKSALLKALTGTDPDRLAEERRRGLTLDLGFAATTLPDGRTLGFVDVPGHSRFLANTLAGIATAPAVLFVVAADAGWQPQSAEHLAAVDAFGIRHGVLAVTRSDLADPGPALTQVREHVAGTSLHGAPALAVSARTGAGLDALRDLLTRTADHAPVPDPHAPVRLWLDRSFTARGAGTVVTGTLTAGTIAVGDPLELAPDGRETAVRGLQCFGETRERVSAPARVAVNLRRVPAGTARRGHALVTPGGWHRTDLVDLALADGTDARHLPAEPLVHCGTQLTGARLRPLAGRFVRLRLRTPLDLHVGDRLLLRDPGSRRLTGARVLDPAPPEPARWRGAAAARARALEALPPDGRDATAQLRLRGLVPAADLRAMGLPAPPGALTAGPWLLDPAHADRLRAALEAEVRAHARARPDDPGLPLPTAAHRLALPDPAPIPALAAPCPGASGGPGPVVVRDGRVYLRGEGEELPPAVAASLRRLRAACAPFHAPTQAELDGWGITRAALALLVRRGHLERHGTVHLPAGAARSAVAVLRGLPQPFTVGECCRALGTTRRVAVPLLEHLDGAGVTRRAADGRRTVAGDGPAQAGPGAQRPEGPPLSR